MTFAVSGDCKVKFEQTETLSKLHKKSERFIHSENSLFSSF